MSLKEKIATAKSTIPDKPEPCGYRIKGYWEKDNKEQQSWIARITGLDEEHGLGREFLNSNEVEWQGKKDDGKPARGIKTWFLPEGIYEVCLFEKGNKTPERYYCGIADASLDTLTREQVESIFREGTEEA